MDLEPVPDLDGNGVPEVAVLARQRDGTRIFVRDAMTGALLADRSLDGGWTPLDLEVVAGPGRQGPRFAVLARRGAAGRARVAIRSLSGGGDLDLSRIASMPRVPSRFAPASDLRVGAAPHPVDEGAEVCGRHDHLRTP